MRHLSNYRLISNSTGTTRFVFRSMAGLGMSICIGTVSLLLCLATSTLDNVLFAKLHDATPTDSVAVKKVGDFRKDLKTFVKQSKSKENEIRFGAVLNLCLLHDQLVNDNRYETNRQLQGFRSVAADRLKKCKKDVQLQILRYERANKQGRVDGPESSIPSPESTEVNFQLYVDIISDDMMSMTSLTGGPVNLWKYTGNPAGPICDHGPDLVNLIENTINPDFWRRNGGDGIIEYYQPLRIIVVGATSQIHDEMTDFLNTVRANGR